MPELKQYVGLDVSLKETSIAPFPLGEVLPSTASAEGKPSLFGRFIGITPSSDSSSACMLIVRLLPA
jgi:hypothetical protein